MRVLVINGPNLDRLGMRQPEIYGTGTLDDLNTELSQLAVGLGVELDTIQTSDESEIVVAIHETGADGLVINPGALSHTSRAIADALRSVDTPAVEVHISNVKDREPWRAHSVTGEACVLTIYGRGRVGYAEALRHLVNRSAMPFETRRYGPHVCNVGDLRTGEEGLIVLIHGGVWRHQYGRDTMETLAVDLTRRGYHTWNITYRVFGTDGGWPGSGHDVLTALEAAPHLGLGPVGGVVGHSAGGYLTLWAVGRTKDIVRSAVVLAPVVDLDDAVAEGGTLAPEARLLLAAGAPPRVAARDERTFVVHGRADQIVPVRHTQGLEAERLETDEGHFELLDPSRPHWSWVVERLACSFEST
ncbi:MAG: type II 3-dehydroquinate dehydratase [Actinobacteria bacterium]|nr:type II 3-dehydroquinate dehydratase [Actinomycetota bacterium]MCI0544590.1 type II 3-dehydroquinate dehydratase [Actinomycetota bacterium]MCI0678773.1 type II 3-dehydroquinate dehydratase [Actinomycetota bacterium]